MVSIKLIGYHEEYNLREIPPLEDLLKKHNEFKVSILSQIKDMVSLILMSIFICMNVMVR
jgi:hypothetical protein